MAKRVTVSIPDMLHEKMEKWRTSFNLSKMFQDAVTEAIQKKEDFQHRIKQDLDMAEIVERLKKEKARSEQNSFDTGREDGLQWGRSASYDDIQYALGWHPDGEILQDPVLGEFFSEKMKKCRFLEIKEGLPNEHFRVYLDGWRKGLVDFWDEVKAKL